MAKRDTNNSTSKMSIWAEDPEETVVTEVQFDSESNLKYNETARGVAIRSLRDALTKYTGRVTGKQYVWNKAGDIQIVDAQDSEYLLALRGGKGCCGNSMKSGRILFEVAK